MPSYRLHLTGHPPSISPDALSHRFTSFGAVSDLTGLGTRNALGDLQAFAFFTLTTSDPAKLARCLTLLNGSTWKGATLHIAIAKPDYSARMASEKKALEQSLASSGGAGGEGGKKVKRKRALKDVDGVKSKKSKDLVDVKNVDGKKVRPLFSRSVVFDLMLM